jgi:hypothetical protein
VHSFVDFNLHIPANALLFFLMANLATSEIVRANRRAPELELPSVRMRKRWLTNAD